MLGGMKSWQRQNSCRGRRRTSKKASRDSSISSGRLTKAVEVKVILPVDKYKAAGSGGESVRFQTLYLLHGVLGSSMDWISGTGIQRWAEARGLAVVMPSGENSFYFDHVLPNSAYGTFIGQELPAMMRKTFPPFGQAGGFIYWRPFYGRLRSAAQRTEIL